MSLCLLLLLAGCSGRRAESRYAPESLPRSGVRQYAVLGGRVWIGDGENDQLVAFDPWAETMYTVPLPATGAVVRNMAVDVERGRVWMALGEAGVLGRIDVPRLGGRRAGRSAARR